MRKSIKIFIAIFVLAIMLLTPVAHAKVNIPEATSDFYVNDFANVFSSSEKAQLMEKAIALSDEHDGIQVVVTTVKSLDGNSVEDYSYEMYNQYGIGKDDMGLLILLATEDRKIRVEVGKSMEAYINDSKAGRFIDQYAIPSLKKDKFNEGLINLQGALIDEVVSNIENPDLATSASSNSEDKAIFLNAVGVFLILLAIIALIVLVVFLISKIKAKRRARKEEIENLNAKIERLEKEKARGEEIAKNNAEFLNGKISNLTDKNDSLELKYQNLQKDHKTLKDRYERAKKLYPNVDSEVTAMIEEEIRQKDMAAAKKADSIIAKVINLTPSKDIVSKLGNAKDYYQTLTVKQKSYVKSDITKLNRLYNESLKLKQEYDRKVRKEKNKKLAKEAETAIMAIISSISHGTASHLSRLKEAKSIYERLDSGACVYFDKSILANLDQLYEQAKRDKKRKEEEEEREERRRRESYYSHDSSSFGGGSGFGGFGGFGGSSGGGGASRGF